MTAEKLNKIISQFLFSVVFIFGISKAVEVVIAIKESKQQKEVLKLEIEYNELRIEQLKRQNKTLNYGNP